MTEINLGLGNSWSCCVTQKGIWLSLSRHLMGCTFRRWNLFETLVEMLTAASSGSVAGAATKAGGDKNDALKTAEKRKNTQ